MKATKKNSVAVSAPENMSENGQEDRGSSPREESLTYFGEECMSSWYVIETVVRDVGAVLRGLGRSVEAEALRSAYIDYSCFSEFRIEELEGKMGEEKVGRDVIEREGIEGSNLNENQDSLKRNEAMLRFLVNGMSLQAESEGDEHKRSIAIEYTCQRLALAARGATYHTQA